MDMKYFRKLCSQAVNSAEYIELTWGELWTDGERLIEEFNARQDSKCPDRWHGCDLYVMYDGSGAPIYVGKSRKRVRMRLLDHRGFGDKVSDGKPSSTVGRYLAENSDSRNWKIRILDAPQELEASLIYHHNSFFNSDHKPKKPSVMPNPEPSFEVLAERDSKRQN